MSFELPQRFWDKVRKGAPDECWEWQGSRDTGGYGLFRYEGRLMKAHRLVLIAYGIQLDGKVGMHKCDNPPCCNLAHLNAGTSKDNSRDAFSKGRRVAKRGSDNNRAKLTESDVLAIRMEYAQLPKSAKGFTPDGAMRRIAEHYNIAYRGLVSIVRNETWSHI